MLALAASTPLLLLGACERSASKRQDDRENSGDGGAKMSSSGGQGSGGKPSDTTTEETNPEPALPSARGFDCRNPNGSVPALQATPISRGQLAEPIDLTFEPNASKNRLFVLERGGRVRILEDGQLLAKPFLDISTKVASEGEQGLLGMAFHPDYAENGLLYLHYSNGTDDSGDTIIEEYKVSTDANIADEGSARLLLKIEQPYNNHNGGSINFGADNLLYIALGDGGSGGDPQQRGQDLTTLLGKILRIDPTQSEELPYTIPQGNLKDSQNEAAPEIWDYGVRNPFRTSFDGCTGDFYIADVGQDELEELNVEPRGKGGRNYGWNVMEGKACYPPDAECDSQPFTAPVWDYGRSSGKSITGGAVYRGAGIPALRGTYFFADYSSGTIWSTRWDPQRSEVSTPVSQTVDLSNVQRVVAISNGADGELYFVSLLGDVFKLEAAE